MSFPSKQSTFYSTYELSKTQRKEQDSSLAHHDILNSSPTKERASAFTSRGSITLEAAFSVSIFFFAAICLVYLLEMMVTQTTIKNALYSVAKEYAEESYLYPLVSTVDVERKIVEHIGEERLERSMIVDGSLGLDMSETKKYWNTTIVDFSVKYRFEIPITIFRIPSPWQKQTVRVKGWTGYEAFLPEIGGVDIVYVTDYGVVYHTKRDCTHLDLSIRAIEKDNIEDIRNKNGGKYMVCLLCVAPLGQSHIYITDYGERYHSSLECSGLKRRVYAVPMTDAYGLGGCSKCVE